MWAIRDLSRARQKSCSWKIMSLLLPMFAPASRNCGCYVLSRVVWAVSTSGLCSMASIVLCFFRRSLTLVFVSSLTIATCFTGRGSKGYYCIFYLGRALAAGIIRPLWPPTTVLSTFRSSLFKVSGASYLTAVEVGPPNFLYKPSTCR